MAPHRVERPRPVLHDRPCAAAGPRFRAPDPAIGSRFISWAYNQPPVGRPDQLPTPTIDRSSGPGDHEVPVDWVTPRAMVHIVRDGHGAVVVARSAAGPVRRPSGTERGAEDQRRVGVNTGSSAAVPTHQRWPTQAQARYAWQHRGSPSVQRAMPPVQANGSGRPHGSLAAPPSPAAPHGN